ncbi:MAG TPA: hypothetical protein DDZ80_08270 [Cyanobacteria bacterium UBA8803]|nr:hypothetical protein [Cyanobacteria bacterium UBA9273]HBL58499.1 hypothetical protein [Cyanobacteria bacterium UBA8803]
MTAAKQPRCIGTNLIIGAFYLAAPISALAGQELIESWVVYPQGACQSPPSGWHRRLVDFELEEAEWYDSTEQEEFNNGSYHKAFGIHAHAGSVTELLPCQ